MALQTIRRGQNAMVQQTRPNANLSALALPSVASLARYVFVSMPVVGIVGQTVVSAFLSPRFRGATANQQLAVQPVAAKWAVDKVTWANQPGVRAAFVTKTTGVLADGDRVDIDVTALVQQIANGQPHYGWRIATTGEAFFYGFATVDSWVLTIETSDAPNTPTVLQPDAGVISASKFVIRTDFTDLAGSTEQTAIQVQVDPDATAPYAFDSGEVATNVPELDLAATAYAGLADGATTKWRVRVKDGDGYWSGWSDWATVTRVAKPTLILDAPTGGVLFDATPTVQAHLSSGTVKAWSVLVTDGDDRTAIRHSNRLPAPSPASAAMAVAIPERDEDGDLVFRDDQTYQIRVRAYDRLDRVQGRPEDPPYIEVWTTVEFDDDDAVTAPATLTADSPTGSPRIRLSWARPGTADGWVITRDGKRIARLNADDVTVNAGTYRWTDPGAAPNETHTWTVRAVTNGKQGLPRATQGNVAVKGLWLMSVHGDVVLDGNNVSGLRKKDRRATYKLPNRRDDIDIVGALEGLSGAYEGSIQYTHYRRTEADVDAARAILEKIRLDPATPVRMVHGTSSIPVLLRNLSVTVGDEYQPNTRQHAVSFECWQVGEF